MSAENRSSGKLSRIKGVPAAIEIDCSTWQRDRSVARSHGKLVRIGQTVSARTETPSAATDKLEPILAQLKRMGMSVRLTELPGGELELQAVGIPTDSAKDP